MLTRKFDQGVLIVAPISAVARGAAGRVGVLESGKRWADGGRRHPEPSGAFRGEDLRLRAARRARHVSAAEIATAAAPRIAPFRARTSQR